MPQFTEQAYKTIINKKKWIDNWFWDRYTINPYNGCSFGCIYCDARSQKYKNKADSQRLPENFENHIIVKKDAAESLHTKLANARNFIPDVVALSGSTDPYQPAEKIFRNTRKILEVLAKQQLPVHIITKSPSVLEDLDLLNQIGRQTWCTISVTITSVNPKVSKFLDFQAPQPKKRLELIRTIKENAPHIQTGVLAIPLVPYLGDKEEDLESLFRQVGEMKADYLLFGGGMTLRDQQALWFLSKLKETHPDLLPKYQKLYKFKYREDRYKGSPVPDGKYLVEKHQFLLELAEQYKLPSRIKRWVPQDYRANNYKLAEVLFGEAYLKQMVGGDWHNLFWAAHNIQNFGLDIATLTLSERKEALNLDEKLTEKINSWIEQHARDKGNGQLFLRF